MKGSSKKKQKKMKKALIIPDCHIPYHDVKAYKLMLAVAKNFQPDEIVILGDFADFYAVSEHPNKNPEAEKALKKELKIVNEKLRELEKLFPKAKLVYIMGNHEYRYDRLIFNKAPALHGIKSAEELLGLDNGRWEVIPYTPDQKYAVGGSKLLARHEPLGGGQHAAHGTVTKGMASFVYAHSHRKDEAHVVSMGGKNFRGFCPGWLGNKKSYAFNFVKAHHQWTLGFGLVHTFPNGNFFHQIVDIVDSKCLVNGKLYEQNN